MKKLSFAEYKKNHVTPYIYHGDTLVKVSSLSESLQEELHTYGPITMYNDVEYYDTDYEESLDDGFYDNPENIGMAWFDVPFYFDKGIVYRLEEEDKNKYVIDWCNIYDKPE